MISPAGSAGKAPQLIPSGVRLANRARQTFSAWPISRGTERRYGAGGEEMATSSLHLIDGVPAMPQPSDLSRSLVALDQNSTIIAVIEMSQSSWLVAGRRHASRD
jgi:hypothetical protein